MFSTECIIEIKIIIKETNWMDFCAFNHKSMLFNILIVYRTTSSYNGTEILKKIKSS